MSEAKGMIIKMMIMPLCYQQQILYDGEITKHDKRQEISNTFVIKNNDKANNSSDIWKELSGKYNIRNASFSDIKNISYELYKAGQISLLDHGILTFDPNESTQKIKPNIFLTQSDSNGRIDWIAEYEARVNRDLKIGNITGYLNNKRILNILKRLI
ncbi:hypothetical protein Q2T46_02160 [Thermoanaerobacterium sp. CMT5567-10]|uniref:hypothetical protein n=1 Tax=Thermoanaerobacterium sp. CMT5567-10 TaxID=3061989 RepID=UPI00287FD039|nr:hypothetical protein [Thermoanaerobacterium sp. CMT5567-10]WKV09285.2 hypothetical protein Q2T46_02160 [Thermoanaerobacterium sp. CMT5567-10]